MRTIEPSIEKIVSRPGTRSSVRFPASGLTLLALATATCSMVEPTRVAPPSLETEVVVRHADLDAVQREFVDQQGRVDYRGLKRNSGRLERYYLWLTRETPDTAPTRFPSRDHELAYWINAYNAAVLVTVVRDYPVSSVTEIGSYPGLRLVDDRIGFFLLQQVPLGGTPTNLYDLENSLIRVRYPDPRIHFALNCASKGCPRLPREAFTGERLNEQLDRETRRFFAEPRNLKFDHERETVWLSPIMDWYESDFTQWMAQTHPDKPATLIHYVSLYAPPEHEAALLRAKEEGYDVDFFEFDWSLNDQNAPGDGATGS